MKVFGVIFKDGHKTYDFLGEDDLKKDDYVIVETEKGLQYAKINADYTKEKEVNDNLNTFKAIKLPRTITKTRTNCSNT